MKPFLFPVINLLLPIEEDELTPPTVVQEGVVELRRDGEVFSFDCQETPDDLDSGTPQRPQHFTTSATRSDRKRASCRETVYSILTAV